MFEPIIHMKFRSVSPIFSSPFRPWKVVWWPSDRHVVDLVAAFRAHHLVESQKWITLGIKGVYHGYIYIYIYMQISHQPKNDGSVWNWMNRDPEALRCGSIRPKWSPVRQYMWDTRCNVVLLGKNEGLISGKFQILDTLQKWISC